MDKKKTLITAIALALGVLILILLLLLDGRKDGTPQSRSYFDLFDTVSTIYDYSQDRDFDKVADEVGKMILTYHELYDVWEKHDGKTTLYTLNIAGGEWVTLDEKIIELLEWGIEIHSITSGEVNIAMGSVTTLWKSALEDGRVPTDAELSDAAMHTDIRNLEIDKAGSRAKLTDPNMRLDVGAVAKGFVEEKIAEWLISEGKSGYAIDMGGNLRAVGTKPSGEGFTTGIRNPDTAVGGFIETFILTDEASATSGGYERYYEISGVRYHHIIDKDTLRPADRYLSASIVTDSAALADALSTAVFCMTEEEISSLVNSFSEEIRIIIVDKDGNILRF